MVRVQERGEGDRIYRLHETGPDGSLSRPRGSADVTQMPDGAWRPSMLEVRPGSRGKGLATALYDALEQDTGRSLTPSGQLLPDGYAFWKARNPEAVQFHQPFQDEFWSPRRLKMFAETGEPEARIPYQQAFDRVPPEGRTPEALASQFYSGGKGGAPVGLTMLMDDASRMARAAEQGYSSQPFYRGEANRALPDIYPGGGFFSRDPDYAAGFARRDGFQAAREFRLDLSNAYGGVRPFSAPEYARLVESAARHDPSLAQHLTDTVTEGRTPPWVSAFAAHNPNYALPLTHGETWPLVERSAAPETILKSAGYDALDIGGRDVRMLGARGIRSVDAAFDPAKRNLDNIFYAAPVGLSLLGAAEDYASSDQRSQFGSASGTKGSPYFLK